MGKMIQNYSLLSELGHGVFSTVYRAVNVKTKQQVAIKMVKADRFKQFPKLEEGASNEINILTNLEPCPHIIRYYDMLKTVNNFYFVYEYCNGGTLQELLKRSEYLCERTALNYFGQIIEAFKILNKHNIMHRDLKPQNLLLHDGLIKLADFGFCKPLENEFETTETMVGSPIYMAPQVLKGEAYTIKADIWSLGVVLFRMLFGFCPFQSNNIGKLIVIIDKEEIKIPDRPKVSQEVIRLLLRMIVKDSRYRADWAEIFSYEVRNCQLIRHDKKGNLKNSCTPSESTGLTRQLQDNGQGNIPYSSRDFTRLHTPLPSSSELLNTQQRQRQQMLKNTSQLTVKNTSQLNQRNTSSSRSPYRDNLRKDLLIKNHLKCVQITALSIRLACYDLPQTVALSCLLSSHVEKQLQGILETMRKDGDVHNGDVRNGDVRNGDVRNGDVRNGDVRNGEELLMRTFQQTLQQQLVEIKSILTMNRNTLWTEQGIGLEMVELRKKDYLRKFVSHISKDSVQQVVLACLIVDYIQQGLIIRKQTFEKMSKEKMLANVWSKIGQ